MFVATFVVAVAATSYDLLLSVPRCMFLQPPLQLCEKLWLDMNKCRGNYCTANLFSDSLHSFLES